MAKRTLVLDASVIVKWFNEEIYTDQAIEIRDNFLKHKLEIVVPNLMYYEVANAILYNKVFSEIEKISIINDLYLLELKTIKHENKLLKNSIIVANKYEIPIYDACYLATADFYNCKVVTADEKFCKKVDLEKVIFIGNWNKNI